MALSAAAGAIIGGLVSSVASGLFNMGTSAMSSGLSYSEQSKLNKQGFGYSQQLQKNQNAFQQSMFNQSAKLAATAHQIEVKDMQDAGLNPILSATGGNGASVVSPMSGSSTTMSGGSAQSIDPGKIDLMNAITSARSVHNDYLRVKNDTKRLDNESDILPYQKDKLHEEASYVNEQNRQLQEYGPLEKQAILNQYDAQTAKALNDINNSNQITAATINNLNSSTRYNNERSRGYNYSGQFGGSIMGSGWNGSFSYSGNKDIYNYKPLFFNDYSKPPQSNNSAHSFKSNTKSYIPSDYAMWHG